MNVIVLNAQLRDAFSPVLKSLQPQRKRLAAASGAANGSTKVKTTVKKQKLDLSADNVPAAMASSASTVPSTAAPAAVSDPAAVQPSKEDSTQQSAEGDSTLQPIPLTGAVPSADPATKPETGVDSLESSSLPPPPHTPTPIDHFKQLSLAITQRLNAHAYTTTQAFDLDLEQLALVAHSSEQQQALHTLREHVKVLRLTPDTYSQSSDGTIHARRQVFGGLAFDTSASIPSLQFVQSVTNSSSASTAATWHCNVDVRHQSIPLGAFATRADALDAYETYRSDLHAQRYDGVTSVYRRAAELARDQRASDARVIAAAASAFHAHASWQRLHDTFSFYSSAAAAAHEHDSTTSAPALATPAKPSMTLVKATTPSKSTAPSKSAPSKSVPSKSTPSKPVPSKSTPSKSTAPSKSTPSKAATPAKSTPSKSTPAKAAASKPTEPEPPLSPTSAMSAPPSPARSTTSSKGKNTKPKKSANRLAHLRLRRLIQMRLCPHLKGQDVCVARRCDEKATIDWTPTGRLEHGRVYCYKREKLVTFAEYVTDHTGHLVSACPNIWVVATRESIDAHLLHCDTFTDAYRTEIGENFKKAIPQYVKKLPPAPRIRKLKDGSL